MRILFVCSGNTCRSPIAAGLARQCLGPGFEIRSAGIYARDRDTVNKKAVQVLSEKGIDISGHQVVRLTGEMLIWADLVFTMTRSQAIELIRCYPDLSPKIMCLGDWLGSGEDVPDPWGGSLEIYRECALTLESILKKIAAKLQP